jgi:hypothetical protein
MLVKLLSTVVYEEDGWTWRSEDTLCPTWEDIEAAIRRLDKFRYPIVWLDLKEVPTEDGAGPRFDLVGGYGDYWFGVFEADKQWRFCDPSQGDDLVPLWTSDQGFSDEARHVCHDLEQVFEAARYFCDTGERTPSSMWE